MNAKIFAKILILVWGVTFALSSTAQNITVSSALNQNTQTLIDQHLAGEGVILSNGTFNNSNTINFNQIGTFDRNGFNTFPFQRGLIMTTGDVTVAPGPNNSGGSSSAITNFFSDPQMTSLATDDIQSCSTLDFDFVAMADTFAFRYIFASEEYPEYVCSRFNDVFAFYLTGMDPVTFQTTTKNVAIIPNSITAANPTGIPVAINTINPGSEGAYGGDGVGCNYQYSSYYNANPDYSQGIQYDGYTTALSAEATIMACQTYHMHLSVCNVGDNSFDSGVFLEEGSFYSPSLSIQENYNFPGYGDTLIQGCRDLDLEFTLPRPNLTAYTTYITFGGNATNGTDYSFILDSGMPLNNDNNSFSFQQDTLVSGHIEVLPTANFNNTDVKTIILYLETVFCEFFEEGHTFDTIYLHIKRHDPIVLEDTVFDVCHQCTEISAPLISGIEPLLYEWTPSTDITNPHARISPSTISSNRTYHLIANDCYGCYSDTAEVEIIVHELPHAGPTCTPTAGCTPLTINLHSENAPDNCNYLWEISNGAFSFTESQEHVSTTLVEPGYYNIYLWMSTAPGCSDSITINNAIRVSDYPHAEFTFAPDEPHNGKDVEFTNLSTGDITNYSWSFGDGSSSTEQNPTHAYFVETSELMNVHLEVSNQDGCSDGFNLTVPVIDNFAFWVPNAFTPNNDGENEVFLPIAIDVASYQFDIYTRTGELFFSTKNVEQGWDGTVNGKLAPMGVYVWKIQYSKFSNPQKTITKTGILNLIR